MAVRTVRPWRPAALGMAGALLLTGCLSESGGGGGGGGGGAGGDGTVEIMYGFGGDQSETFQGAVNAWADEEGIEVQFSSTPDFDKLIRSRVQGNNLPDIAVFPQPGITLDIAESGSLADLTEVVDTAEYNEENVYLYNAAANEEGAVFALPMSTSVKSLVWYPKGPFEEGGYEVPQSQEELLALTEQIKADGITPWCVGIESGPATGWPATDWLEDYVLRVGGADFYRQWVNNEVPFNHPTVIEAGQHIADIWFPEGNVLGGRNAITSNNFATSGNPMFEDPPGCMLHRQASFLAQPGNFPDEVVNNLDEVAGVFPLPPIEAGDGQPIMGAGDLAGLFSQDDEDSIAVLQFITGREIGETWAPEGGYISPWKDFDPSLYPNDTMRDIAEIAYTAEEVVFDGSDTMPGEVGAGSFWREMVSWVRGEKELEASLQTINESWPQS